MSPEVTKLNIVATFFSTRGKITWYV